MVAGFYEDLSRARKSERLVRNVFAGLTEDYTFTTVGNEREYFHKGDVKAVAPDGREIFIEVKEDKVIHSTGNILCEEEVYYKDTDYYGKGNMYSEYDIYTIVSRAERKIYVLDFKKLQEIYKMGEYKIIHHPSQNTYCYLLPLGIAKAKGAMITTLEY